MDGANWHGYDGMNAFTDEEALRIMMKNVDELEPLKKISRIHLFPCPKQ